MTSNQEDKIITEFLESIGPWRGFIVIGGGFALFIYKLYLSDPKLKNPPVGTRDIDSLIPRKIPEVSKRNIQSYLREAGFNHIFKDLDDPATEAYVKDIAGSEVEVEFLTDDSVRNNKDKKYRYSECGSTTAQLLNFKLTDNLAVPYPLRCCRARCDTRNVDIP